MYPVVMEVDNVERDNSMFFELSYVLHLMLNETWIILPARHGIDTAPEGHKALKTT